eukprot:CAMPEP_0117025432 /NCGR_PEP_ID=MMETSP0472-20121206/18784_1 /TAXON_ID=693140 ORGANISM="Tiarina fusus, Strain LIS" /NCGR_SAMPLE_ID=MMETSP0472 /ASSEMBLY_ACC=CAM_ASM_000603 /LENGTH=375 /DNA_ID=CAMNT_0004732139 /DNA_START=141 /DNA_END=1268 /DNA_ORIENTATION=-
METIPAYRVMDNDGKLIKGANEPQSTEEECVKMYRHMLSISVMDKIMYDIQRQGRISFYMTCNGEEATHTGSAAALKDSDTIFAQYREQGVLLWRGFSMEQMMHQCFSNAKDFGKGRQMPVHYGSKAHNFQAISSPLATQIPQASGAAYAQKIMGLKDACTVAYFGEGAASEGDFHAALNFAATLECPVIFFCRNNGFAISTPAHEQFRGDGIASRGIGYGIDTLRVDGNDLFAVMDVTKKAREICVNEGRPVLVETMSYRVGHHSTSDDSSRYRPTEEIQGWVERNNPITRFRGYMENKGWWDADKDAAAWKDIRKSALQCLKLAEAQKKPALSEMFTDVYDEKPLHLKEQEESLKRHLEQYGYNYPLDEHAGQ